MSTNYFTTKQSYHHLSEVGRGKIKAYLPEGLKLAEIARGLGKHRSTISREVKRETVRQVKQVNGKKVYYEQYFENAAQNRYNKAKKGVIPENWQNIK